MSSSDERECVPCFARARRDSLIALEPGVLVAVEELMESLGDQPRAAEFEMEVIAGRPYVRTRTHCD